MATEAHPASHVLLEPAGANRHAGRNPFSTLAFHKDGASEDLCTYMTPVQPRWAGKLVGTRVGQRIIGQE